MRRATGALLAFGLSVGGAAASASQSAVPQGYSVAARSDLAPGVEYSRLTTGGPIVAHVAHVLPGAPVDLAVVNAGDKLSTGPTELETTSSMCGREHCVVGVNGDFHDNGVPLGGVVAGGRMLQSPDPARPQLSVTKDGHLVAGAFPWSGALTFADGGQIAVGAVNSAPPANGLALYTPDYGGATPTSNRTELVVGLHGPAGALNQTVNADLRGLRSGAGPIPADGAVLSADGAAAQQLADAWARGQNGGLAPRARVALRSPMDATDSLGAYPIVLHAGRKATPYGNDPNLIYPQQPHTLVAWNPAGDVYLVAVDGRQASSVGVTMDQAADFVLGLGATEAVNLDGGGGTTLVEGATVVNRPSDPDPAHPGGWFQRGATNAFVVMARPGSSPTTTIPRPVVPMSVSPATPSTTGAGAGPGADSLPDAASGGGGLFGPISGAIGEVDPADLPVGPSPTGIGTALAAATPNGAPRLQPSAPAPGGDEAAQTAPPPLIAAGQGAGDGATPTTTARPDLLSEASSDSSDIIDAALGGGREGHEAPTRPAVMGFATALAVTGVVTHRRRRGRRGLATAQPVQPAMMAAALEYVAPSLDRVVMFTEVPNENPLQILVGAS